CWRLAMTDPVTQHLHQLPLDRAWALARGEEPDAFAVLGMHPVSAGQGGPVEVRAFLPGAEAVTLVDRATDEVLASLQPTPVEGLFVARLPAPVDYRLRIHWPGAEQDTEDAYRLPPTLTGELLARFHQGDAQAALALGARPMRHAGIEGVRFAV